MLVSRPCVVLNFRWLKCFAKRATVSVVQNLLCVGFEYESYVLQPDPLATFRQLNLLSVKTAQRLEIIIVYIYA